MKLIYLFYSTYLSAFFVPRTHLKKAGLLLFSVALLLINGSTTVRGQSALDGFDPKANGVVRVVVVQPDGKILLGGEFTTLSPNGGATVGRNRIARLNADGTLDPGFRPNANGAVDAIVVQPDGKILVGGQFNGATSIGGQTRNYIARLDATTGDADSFDPNANGVVRTIALQSDGKILAGGVFTTIGGQTRNHIARLNAVFGAADVSFDPDANDVVRVITLQPDGKILVGGQFLGANSIGGKTRNYIARLDTGGVADSFNPNANEVVRAIAVQADGKILAGGVFTGASSIGGQTRNRIARLDPTTGAADSFNPNANGDVLVITLQTDGKILAGGDFTGANSIGGQTRNRIARLDPATGLADSFDPKANDTVRTIAQQPDGKILAGGVFTTLAPSGAAPVTRNQIARLETDGRLDQTLNLSIVGSVVYVTAVQPDGKTLIGGIFTSVLGGTRNRIARLNTDGTLDTAFNPSANGPVYSIAVQADGKILVGGAFTGIGGQTRNYIGRLDATTGLADFFNPDANDEVYAISVQADGKILVGGAFATHGTPSIGGEFRNRMARLDPITGLADSFDPNVPTQVNASQYVDGIVETVSGKILVSGNFEYIGGQSRNNIARLNPGTGAADAWDPNPNTGLSTMAVQTDGKVVVGGSFTSIGGQLRNRIARLDPVTGLADSFDPNADGIVSSIAIQADGKKLVIGSFTTIGGALRNHVARLAPNTGVADSFDPNPTGSVYSVGLQPDGKIVAAGDFTAIGGQSRNYFARLSDDTAALQDLAVTQTSITWTRGGSSPQLRRATFAYSTDKVNYTILGDGLDSGSTWSMTGLSLPTGLNIYVRARGYFNRSGYNAYSESITESVRNVALPQPFLTIQRTAGTNIVLSWSTNFTGYTLEASTNLNSNVWNDVSAQPVVSGTNNAVTNSTAAPARFYRLRK